MFVLPFPLLGLETDQDVLRGSCLCLSWPCFRAEETRLIEYYLSDREPKGDQWAPISWAETTGLGIGDVRTLAMPIINQVCEVREQQGASWRGFSARQSRKGQHT